VKELFQYILKPTAYSSYSKLSKATFFKLLLTYFGLSLFFAGISAAICYIFHIKHNDIEIESIMKSILLVVFLAPIYEEIIFRGLLVFKRKNLVLFFIVSAILLFISIFRQKYIVAIVLASLIVFLISSLVVFGVKRMKGFIDNRFAVFYYSSSVLFGLIHIFNFSGNVKYMIIFAIFLTAPQIIMGFVNGFLRIKYGLIYSIIFHIFVNTSFVLSLIHK